VSACRDTICRDCGVDVFDPNEYYMLLDSVWAQTGVEFLGGMLCVGCVEARLGRRLEPGDFSAAPINWPRPGLSARLLDRLGPTGPPGMPQMSQ
jgi:hypothetical protein